MKTKVTAAFVVGYDDQAGDHVLIRNGQVVYQDTDIIYVGTAYTEVVDETIDAGLSLLCPGFIDLNALGDIDHELLHIEAGALSRNMACSKEYFEKGSHEVMTAEEEAFKSLYAYTQLILHGFTTAMPITSTYYKKWAETYEELAAAAHHAGELGLRIYLGPSYQCGIDVVNQEAQTEVFWDEAEGMAGLERAVRFVKEFDGTYDGLVHGMLAPERIENQTEESLIAAKRYSDELKCPIRLHAAQGAFEYREIYKKHKKTPLQYLHSIGFLGERTAIPHALFVPGFSQAPPECGSGDDIALLVDTKTTVLHCPLVYARHGEMLESFAKYSGRGVRMALGTDTFPPDPIQNIRMGAFASRIVERTVPGSTYADLFRAATLGGAKYLGRDDLGRLAVGAKADMVAFDLSGYHLGALDDPLRTLILSGSGRDAKLSIINGRVVMKDRCIPKVDLEQLRMQGQAYYDKMKLGYVERDYQHLGEKKLFQPSFPFKE